MATTSTLQAQQHVRFCSSCGTLSTSPAARICTGCGAEGTSLISNKAKKTSPSSSPASTSRTTPLPPSSSSVDKRPVRPAPSPSPSTSSSAPPATSPNPSPAPTTNPLKQSPRPPRPPKKIDVNEINNNSNGTNNNNGHTSNQKSAPVSPRGQPPSSPTNSQGVPIPVIPPRLVAKSSNNLLSKDESEKKDHEFRSKSDDSLVIPEKRSVAGNGTPARPLPAPAVGKASPAATANKANITPNRERPAAPSTSEKEKPNHNEANQTKSNTAAASAENFNPPSNSAKPIAPKIPLRDAPTSAAQTSSSSEKPNPTPELPNRENAEPANRGSSNQTHLANGPTSHGDESVQGSDPLGAVRDVPKFAPSPKEVARQEKTWSRTLKSSSSIFQDMDPQSSSPPKEQQPAPPSSSSQPNSGEESQERLLGNHRNSIVGERPALLSKSNIGFELSFGKSPPDTQPAPSPSSPNSTSPPSSGLSSHSWAKPKYTKSQSQAQFSTMKPTDSTQEHGVLMHQFSLASFMSRAAAGVSSPALSSTSTSGDPASPPLSPSKTAPSSPAHSHNNAPRMERTQLSASSPALTTLSQSTPGTKSGFLQDRPPLKGPPTAPPANASLLEKIIYEMLSTEWDYLQELQVLSSIQKMMKSSSVLPLPETAKIFGNIEQILLLNMELYRTMMPGDLPEGVADDTRSQSSRIAQAFTAMADYMKMYAAYCSKHQDAVKVMDHNMKKPDFKAFIQILQQKPECKNQFLSSFLIKPIQRLCKYPLLLRELIKHTLEDDPSRPAIIDALDKIEITVEKVNEQQRTQERMTKLMQIRNELIEGGSGFELMDVPTRIHLSDCALNAYINGKKTKDGYMYLFNDMLLFIRRPGHNTVKVEASIPLDQALVRHCTTNSHAGEFVFDVVHCGQKVWTFVAETQAQRDSLYKKLEDMIDSFLQKNLSNG